MRDVLDRLERLGLRWYITGSEAASCYGVLRRTFDTDIVLDLEPGRFARVRRAFDDDQHLVSDEIDYGDFSMASVIVSTTMAKAGLILRRPSPWTASTLARRQRLDHPSLGITWVSSLEDLILAKLVWSEGTSELQLRDCGMLLRVNDGRVDDAYLDRWADPLASHPSSRRCGMRADPGRDIQEALIAGATLERRVAVVAALRMEGLLLAWQQSDEAGLPNELERAFFLLDRVYPEMPPAHRASARAQLEARWRAGTWHGFRRPEPLGTPDG